MADWYVSSAAYALVTTFTASHLYSIGDIIKPTSPASGREYCYRCTTGGTSSTEPTWSGAYNNNATVTSGGATFTNVTAQSTYGWSAPAGSLWGIGLGGVTRPASGDRVFVSSDHSESGLGTAYGMIASNTSGSVQIISVSRAGSVPPVAADITAGVTITSTSNLVIEAPCNTFWQGVTFITTGGSIFFTSSYTKGLYLKDCKLYLNNSTASSRVSTQNPCKVTLDNTSIQFGNASQSMASTFGSDITWINTATPFAGAVFPTTLINVLSAPMMLTARGVDFSSLTGTLLANSNGGWNKVLLDSCKIASGLTRYQTPGATTSAGDEVELINCYDGTNVINERWTQAGSLTTDYSTYMNLGANNDIGNYALKAVSNSIGDRFVIPFELFQFDVENTATGSSKTATVELVSSASLNNNDVHMYLEYMGTSGNPLASFIESFPTVLTTVAALNTSSKTWNSPPSTPVYQNIQITFTPQRAGRVRGFLKLGKASATVWVNPMITIS